VDDSEEIALMLREVIENLGLAVQTVRSGEEALQRISDDRPDLILMDVMLPGLSGYDVVRRIRESEGGEYTPIIMVTVKKDTESKVKGLEAGADDYVTKPFDINELGARIRSMLRIKRLQDSLLEANRQLRELSFTDPLTGFFNRRFFDEQVSYEFSRADRYGLDLSCIMADIDAFKKINDTRGHLVGDDVLRRIAGVIRKAVRQSDAVFRYGGDEFVVLLPETGDPYPLAERIRRNVSKQRLGNDETEKLSLSLGVVSRKNQRTASATELVRFADEALYAAKRAGGNRVILYDADSAVNGRSPEDE